MRHRHPPGTLTPEELRELFQAAHPEVGFSRLPHCEDPDKRWVAYWWDAGKGEARHIPGPTLADVLDDLTDVFGTAWRDA